MTGPEDRADAVITYVEALGCRLEVWQAQLIRQWWGGVSNRCERCDRATDSGESLCAICKYLILRSFW